VAYRILPFSITCVIFNLILPIATTLAHHLAQSSVWQYLRRRQQFRILLKGKGSPYSITERRIPELIPVLGSQPAGDVSHKPGGRLPLLSTRPAVTSATLKRVATNFTAWWTEAQWVWTVCLRLLPDSVAAAIWIRAFCAWVQHANHLATEPPFSCTWFFKKI